MSRDDVRVADSLIKQEGYVWRSEVYANGQREVKYVFGYKTLQGNPDYQQAVAGNLNELAQKLSPIINGRNITFMNFPRDEVGMGIRRDRPLSAEEMDALCDLLSRTEDSRR